jgi:hypothetical protein
MRNRIICCALAAPLVIMLMPALAVAGQTETGNGCPSGAHHNLNIIGMAHAKHVDPDSITGVNLDFNGAANDQTPVVSFGHDITVNATTVSSDTSLVVEITIGATAVLGWRPVSVTLPDGTVMTIWFQVL